MKGGLWQHFTKSIDIERNDVKPQLFGQKECTAMEALNMAVRGTGALGKYHNGVTLAYFLSKCIKEAHHVAVIRLSTKVTNERCTK